MQKEKAKQEKEKKEGRNWSFSFPHTLEFSVVDRKLEHHPTACLMHTYILKPCCPSGIQACLSNCLLLQPPLSHRIKHQAHQCHNGVHFFPITCSCSSVLFLTSILPVTQAGPPFLPQVPNPSCRQVNLAVILPPELLLILFHCFHSHYHCSFWSLVMSMIVIS